MANTFVVSITGLTSLKKRLDKYAKDLEPDIDAVLELNAIEIQENAKRLAPSRKKINTDNQGRQTERAGTLRQSITVGPLDGRLGYQIGTNVFYAPYMEFGTGNLARSYVATLPTEFQEMAIQYKAEPRKRLINIAPRPFLYPSYRGQLAQIIKDLNNVLKP